MNRQKGFVTAVIGALILLSGCSPRFEGKEDLLESLNDSSGVEFRDIRQSTFDGRPLVCGEINWKTPYGGYGGFRNFMIKSGIVYVGDDGLSSSKLGLCCAISSSQDIKEKMENWDARYEAACNSLDIVNLMRH